MALPDFFVPAGYASLAVSSVSSFVAIPAGGTALRVTNSGSNQVFVLVGASGVEVTPETGLILMAGESIYLGPGAAIAAITSEGYSSLYIATGA